MASSAPCCPVRQVLVHVYPSSSKAFDQPRVTVHIGRRGRPVQKPRLMPLRTATARKLQASHIGTVSVL
jgi:predicted Abi (CAAX) family protease